MLLDYETIALLVGVTLVTVLGVIALDQTNVR